MTNRANKIFEEIKTHCIDGMGFKEIDYFGIEMLANSIERYFNCQDILTKEGLTQEAKKTGFLVPRPECALQKQSLEIIIKFFDRFGLSPAARKKILGKAAQEKKKKKFEGFDLTIN
jgi:P27 family predicted phage terminase small subunit